MMPVLTKDIQSYGDLFSIEPAKGFTLECVAIVKSVVLDLPIEHPAVGLIDYPSVELILRVESVSLTDWPGDLNGALLAMMRDPGDGTCKAVKLRIEA